MSVPFGPTTASYGYDPSKSGNTAVERVLFEMSGYIRQAPLRLIPTVLGRFFVIYTPPLAPYEE